MEYIGNFLEIMTEAEVFVEVAFGKLMDGLDYIRFVLFGGFIYKFPLEEVLSLIFGRAQDMINGALITVQLLDYIR